MGRRCHLEKVESAGSGVHVCVCVGGGQVYKNKSQQSDRKIKESIGSLINHKHGGTSERGREPQPRPLVLCSDRRPGPSVHKTFTLFDTELERSSRGPLLAFQSCPGCHQGGSLNVTIVLGRRFEWIIQFSGTKRDV